MKNFLPVGCKIEPVPHLKGYRVLILWTFWIFILRKKEKKIARNFFNGCYIHIACRFDQVTKLGAFTSSGPNSLLTFSFQWLVADSLQYQLIIWKPTQK